MSEEKKERGGLRLPPLQALSLNVGEEFAAAAFGERSAYRALADCFGAEGAALVRHSLHRNFGGGKFKAGNEEVKHGALLWAMGAGGIAALHCLDEFYIPMHCSVCNRKTLLKYQIMQKAIMLRGNQKNHYPRNVGLCLNPNIPRFARTKHRRPHHAPCRSRRAFRCPFRACDG